MKMGLYAGQVSYRWVTLVKQW